MTLLFVTSRYPYPTLKGDQVRAHHQIRALARQGHEVVLVTFDNGQRNAEFEKVCKAVYLVEPPSRASVALRLGRLLFSTHPLQLAFFHAPAMTLAIEQAVTTHQPETAVVQLSRLGQYLRVLQQHGVPTLIDLIDSLAMNIDLKAKKASFPLNLLWQLEAKRLHAYELEAVTSVAVATVVSQRDKDYLGSAAIKVNPNGVNVSELSASRRDTATLLFHGNMSYYPNVEAAKFLVNEVMPLVWQSLPQCQVKLVGAAPTREVLSLAAERVEVTGFVSDIRPYLASVTLGVYPILRATGIQNKILEAMMQGLPVITTSTVAEGLQEGRAGQHFIQAETANDIAKQVLVLLHDHSRREALGRAGRTLVLEHYTWEKTAGMLVEYLGLIVFNKASGKSL
jgi:polysaccharide biosynthesis protein PslH